MGTTCPRSRVGRGDALPSRRERPVRLKPTTSDPIGGNASADTTLSGSPIRPANDQDGRPRTEILVGNGERSMSQPPRTSPLVTRDRYDAILFDLDGVLTNTA